MEEMKRSNETLIILLKLFVVSEMYLGLPQKSDTAQKMKFSIKDFFCKCDQIPQFPADLVTLTEEMLNGKLHFLCREKSQNGSPFKKNFINNFLLMKVTT